MGLLIKKYNALITKQKKGGNTQEPSEITLNPDRITLDLSLYGFP